MTSYPHPVGTGGQAVARTWRILRPIQVTHREWAWALLSSAFFFSCSLVSCQDFPLAKPKQKLEGWRDHGSSPNSSASQEAQRKLEKRRQQSTGRHILIPNAARGREPWREPHCNERLWLHHSAFPRTGQNESGAHSPDGTPKCHPAMCPGREKNWIFVSSPEGCHKTKMNLQIKYKKNYN